MEYAIRKIGFPIISEKKVGSPESINGKEATSIALVGVGTPINDSDWRVSMLNLARRRAEKIGIRMATISIKGWYLNNGCHKLGNGNAQCITSSFILKYNSYGIAIGIIEVIFISIILKIIIPGKTPKLTTSARESNSFPIGLVTFNKRAAKPSKKSKTAARNIYIDAEARK